MTGDFSPAACLRSNTQTEIPPGYKNREQAAKHIHRSKSTLNKYASKGKHFSFIRRGKHTYYKIADLDAFTKNRQTF